MKKTIRNGEIVTIEEAERLDSIDILKILLMFLIIIFFLQLWIHRNHR